MRRLVRALLLAAVVPCVAAWTWPVRGPVLQTFSFDPAHPYAAGEHRGIAIGAGTGAPVVAPAAGTVTFAGTVPTNGKSVTILTPAGLAVSLTHLGSIAVAQNASVAEGDLVGSVGPSGTPELDVPYVHLGIRQASNDQGYLDPLGFLPVLAPPSPQPEPAPAPAPAPAPTAPSAAPVVAAPEPAAPPAPASVPASPVPASVSAPAVQQPVPSPPPTPDPAPASAVAEPASGVGPGVTITAATAGAGRGIAVTTLPAPSAVVQDGPRRAVSPAGIRSAVVRAATVSPAVRAPRHAAATQPVLAVVSGHHDVPVAAVPPHVPAVAGTPRGAGAHGPVRLAIGVGALGSAVIFALLWVRWRLRPEEQRERTALV